MALASTGASIKAKTLLAPASYQPHGKMSIVNQQHGIGSVSRGAGLALARTALEQLLLLNLGLI
jgi:hypothetical protein